jgi:phosphoglycolate phosphatase-like HAD superfamily hydrolase
VGSRSSVKRFLETYLATYYAVTLDRSRPFPNVFDALETLSGRFSLALITMRFVDNKKLMEELRKLGFLKYFRVVVTALDVRSPKPSPEALLKCARCLNVSLRQCVTVGDSVVDVRAGKLAGTKTVAVISGLFSREELEKEQPDVIIQNFSEIPSLLL